MYSENSKILICSDSFSKQIYNIWVIFRLISVFETTALLNLPVYSKRPKRFYSYSLVFTCGRNIRSRDASVPFGHKLTEKQ